MAVMIGAGIMMGLSALSSASAAEDQNKQIRKNYINQLNDNAAYNKAVQEANLKNTLRAGYRVSVLNMQYGQLKQQLAASGVGISKAGAEALSSNAANAAATNSIGSSADAVVTDIKSNIDKAYGQLDQDALNQAENFNQAMNDLIYQGIDSLQSTRNMDYSGPQTVDVGKAALTGAINSGIGMAAQYYGGSMSLGLGKATSTAASGSGITGGGIGFKAPSGYGYSPGNSYSLLGG